MGLLNLLVLCLAVCCVGGLGKSVGAPGAPGAPGEYKYNHVMKKLFDEMNSVMSHIVARKKTNGGNIIRSSTLVQKVKEILVEKNNTRKAPGGSDNSKTTEAIGVFRSIFSKVAGGIDQLYVKRKQEDDIKEGKMPTVSNRKVKPFSKPERNIKPVAAKPDRKKVTAGSASGKSGKSGKSKKILEGVDIPTAKHTINPLLKRLKESDFKRKHEYIYYEEDEEEGSGAESTTKKRGSDATAVFDDTERGSGAEDDDVSGDDEEGDMESGSGGGKVPVARQVVKVVEGKGYGQVARQVARARDRKL